MCLEPNANQAQRKIIPLVHYRVESGRRKLR